MTDLQALKNRLNPTSATAPTSKVDLSTLKERLRSAPAEPVEVEWVPAGEEVTPTEATAPEPTTEPTDYSLGGLAGVQEDIADFVLEQGAQLGDYLSGSLVDAEKFKKERMDKGEGWYIGHPIFGVSADTELALRSAAAPVLGTVQAGIATIGGKEFLPETQKWFQETEAKRQELVDNLFMGEVTQVVGENIVPLAGAAKAYKKLNDIKKFGTASDSPLMRKATRWMQGQFSRVPKGDVAGPYTSIIQGASRPSLAKRLLIGAPAIAGAGYVLGLTTPRGEETFESRQVAREEAAELGAMFSAGLKGVFEIVPAVGKTVKNILKPSNEYLEKGLAEEFYLITERINQQRLQQGLPAMPIHRAIADMDEWVNEVARINKEYGANVALPPEVLIEAPHFTAFLRRFDKSTTTPLAELLGGPNNADEYRKIFADNAKNSPKSLEKEVDRIFKEGKRTEKELLELDEKMAALMEDTPTKPVAPSDARLTAIEDAPFTPQAARQQLGTNFLRRVSEEGNKAQQRYGAFTTKIDQLPIAETELSGYLDELMGTLGKRAVTDMDAAANIIANSRLGKTIQFNPETWEIQYPTNATIKYADINNLVTQLTESLNKKDTSQWGANEGLVRQVRDFFGASDVKDYTLLDKGQAAIVNPQSVQNRIIDTRGGSELLQERADVMRQYKEFRDKAREFDDVIGTTQQAAINTAQGVKGSTDVTAMSDKLARTLLRSRKDLDTVAGNYPSVVPDLEEVILADIAKKAESPAGLSLKTLQKYRVDNKDVLSSPYLAGVNRRLDTIQDTLEKEKSISSAQYKQDMDDFLRSKEARAALARRKSELARTKRKLSQQAGDEGLSTIRKALDNPDTILDNPATMKAVLGFAYRNGAAQDVKNLYRDRLWNKISTLSKSSTTSEVDEAADVLKQLDDITSSLVDPNKKLQPQREIFEMLYTPAERKPIEDAIKLMRRSVEAANLRGKIPDEPPIQSAALELGAILTRALDPAEATRFGVLTRLFQRNRTSEVVQNILATPESAMRFLQMAQNPSAMNQRALIDSFESLSVPIYLGGASILSEEPIREAVETENLKQGGYSQDDIIFEDEETTPVQPEVEDEQSSIMDTIGDVAGAVRDTIIPPAYAGEEGGRPLTGKNYAPKEVAMVGKEVAKEVGLPDWVVLTTLAAESSMGKLAPKNPMQIFSPAYKDAIAFAGDKYGLQPGNRTQSLRDNILGGAVYLKKLISDFKKNFGEAPRIHELYMTYSMGMTGYKQWRKLKEQDDKLTPVAKKVTEQPAKKYFYDEKTGRPYNWEETEQAYLKQMEAKLREAKDYL
jgi:hypothetical protein